MTWCKKCKDKYYVNGGISYGAVRLCTHCNEIWEDYYRRYKSQRFPDGIPFWWLNNVEIGERDKLFNEWINPIKTGCYYCIYRRKMLCSAYSENYKIYNHKVCQNNDVKTEKDLLMILSFRGNKYDEFGKPFGYLCPRFKANRFVFR